MSDLPFRAEYSKSGRAGCKGCRTPIAKETLRLAVMIQSPFFDGKQPNWYHHACFFIKQRPKTVGDIAHFESLRWEDQEMIKNKIGTGGGGDTNGSAPVAKSKAKKRAATSASVVGEFKVEYSVSSRATCRGCDEKIMKEEVRVSKKDFESEEARKYGGLDLWHHLDCFVKLRDSLGFWESGVTLPGYKSMVSEDKKAIKTKLPPKEPTVVKEEVDGVVAKKVKTEHSAAANGDDAKAREQNKLIFKYRDFLKKNLSKAQMSRILSHNKQEIPAGEERILDRLSDMLAFGRLAPCSKCNGGQLTYRSGVGYQCQGDLTEWVKCQDINLDPKRGKCSIPSDLQEEFAQLKKYKCKPTKREMNFVQPTQHPSTSTSGGDVVDGKSTGPFIHRIVPLKNMEVVILGSTNQTKEEIKSKVTKLGGKVITKIHEKLGFVISNKDELDKMNKRMSDVKDADIQVVTEDILDKFVDMPQEDVFIMIKKKSICDWGTDPKSRIPVTDRSKSIGSTGKSGSALYSKSMSKVKLQLKGGAYVDPDSKLEHKAHVYKHKGDYYNSVLGLTDIQQNKNSYYKMQVLESDNSNKFWLFRSWGRIGTTIGGTKVESTSTLNEARQLFEDLFLEKTANEWSNRKRFVKRIGKMYPVDVDYGENETQVKLEHSDLPCKLEQPVQDLIKMLFDVDTMKKTMLEFELDMEKMPLGKISQKQLKEAYSLLTDLQQAIINEKQNSIFLDLSNRFYTLIPHSFGVENPPILNTDEQIKMKIDMVASLMEIEIAYKLLRSGAQDGVHPLETHYEQLKADIKTVDKTSEEFVMLQKYVRNTHAATHTQYDLEIDEIFKVSRHNEAKRYKGYKKLANRKLLWHGSRLTNFAGILSQGLRIAPPEAPVTGYMFGKGIYFADMVSKSANYCCTSKSNPTGLLLLCEVALGKMCERYQAETFVKPPPGYHCVKGVGMTEPDPEQAHQTPEGVEVPLGPGVTTTKKQCSLLYNEYIVYDQDQLEIQYLLKMKFNHKY